MQNKYAKLYQALWLWIKKSSHFKTNIGVINISILAVHPIRILLILMWDNSTFLTTSTGCFLWVISKLKDAITKIILACLLSFIQLSQNLWLCYKYISQNVCLFYLCFCSNIFLSINIYKVSLELWTEMHVGLHIKYSLLRSHFNQNWSMVINLWPPCNIKFHGNQWRVSQVIICRPTEG
jgi:hypothetical protein